MHNSQERARGQQNLGICDVAIARAILTALLSAFVVLEVHAAPVGSVRGGAVALPSDEIAPAERARIKAAIAANIDALQRSGRLAHVVPREAPGVTFQWPLQLVPGHPEQVARTVINFVDRDPAFPGQLLDYACGTRTYDTADGYNHRGTDITSYPFAERKQANDEAIVVAAAAGTIVFKEDGQPDQSCSLNMLPWNAVYLRHADGSTTWYGHLKEGSLTVKNVGDTVDAGEFLGVMGSSGDSTGPHVHFEVYDSAGNLIDPFAGPCNPSTAQSWWADQRPYNEPAIDLVMTGDAPVEFSACPSPEAEHRSAYFQPGQTVYAATFLTDQLSGNGSAFSVYTPDGTLFATRMVPTDADYYSASYWEWSFQLPTSAPAGSWRLDVSFNGQTKSATFDVGDVEPPREDAIEYYNASINHYFMTSFPEEAAALDIGVPVAGWTRTGKSFPTYSAPGADLAATCRFFGTPGRGINSHFYTVIPEECALVKQNPDWMFEAIAFYIAAPDGPIQCPQYTRPVFRLYNNGQGGQPNHRYTTSWSVISLMQSQGWWIEGVGMCAPL